MSTHDYAVVRLLDPHGSYHANVETYGPVEVRGPRVDSPDETVALQSSCDQWGLAVDLTRCMRIACIVSAESDAAAHDAARLILEEAVDVLDSANWGRSRFEVLGPGFARRLDNGRIFPRKHPKVFGPFTSYLVGSEQLAPPTLQQFLMHRPRLELSSRLVRSMHWLRTARNDASRQRAVLFRWFALEAILRQSKEDDIVPQVSWCLGFPMGKGAALVDPTLRGKLQSHPHYASWRKEVQRRLESIRSFRNDSVHSGFREQDVSGADLRGFEELLTMTAPRVMHFATQALVLGAETQADLIEYLPVILQTLPNLVNDLHGTVIYLLENPRT